MNARLTTVAVQFGAVAAGYVLGRVLAGTPGTPQPVIGGLMCAADLLLFVGVLVSAPRSRRAWWRSLAALAWAVIVVGWEVVANERLGLSPYIFANHTTDLLFAAGCLFPALLIIGPLIRARAWVTAGGMALFAVGFVALLTYNAHNRGSTAVGFVLTIRD